MASVSQTASTLSRPEPSALKWGVWLMSFAGLAFIGYGIIFFIRNFTGEFLELGIGEGQVASSKDEIKAFDNDLFHYISHLHIAISGFIAAVGLAVIVLAWFGVRRGYWWAWIGAVATPVLALLVALPAHYPWGFDTIGHLGLIYLATAIFVAGAVLSLKVLREQQTR
jgi:hypothetical protein